MTPQNKKEIQKILSDSLVWGACFFVAGVGAALFVPTHATVIGLGVAAVWTFFWGVSGWRGVLAAGITSVVFFGVGMHAGNVALVESEESPVIGKRIVGEGVVIDDVSVGEFAQRVPVAILTCAGAPGCAGERVAVSTDRFRSVLFGDTVKFSCVPETAKNFSDDFDFRLYLAAKGIRAVCEDGDMRSVSGNDTLWGYLGRARRTLENNVNRFVGEPMAALGNGLLFGGSNRLSDALAADFAATSMTHIVAVSGYNVALVGMIVFSSAIFCGLWRRGATAVACAGIVAFVLLVGSPLSGVRAGVMGMIVLWTMVLGRMDATLRALLWAVVIMVAANPLIVRYDTGFQLSVLATLGIVLFSPWYERARPNGMIARAFFDILYATSAAQLLVVPVLLATFGSFSLVSFATNLLVLWTLPWAMLFVFCAAVFGGVFDFLGFVSGVLAQAVLWYDICVIRFFATVKSGTLLVTHTDVGFLVLWYAAVTGCAVFLHADLVCRRRAMCRKKAEV